MSSSPPPNKPQPSQHAFQAPTGTRDFYPAELNRLRYIQDAWRKTSINHGFEEIDGPTFEHLELYTAKSGEGIVSELFSFERFGGEKTFALRPEFTPTLARMYASKAASLPKPTKWFWQQNCYRAERPQRGRLREFSQWNCDIINHDDSPEARVEADADAIACCVGLLKSLRLDSSHFRVKINDRGSLAAILKSHDIPEERHQAVFTLLDKKEKLDDKAFNVEAKKLGIPDSLILWFRGSFQRPAESMSSVVKGVTQDTNIAFQYLEHMEPLRRALNDRGVDSDEFELSQTVIRGLAYYTGMVFEVHEATGAERAIAGGGRYDKLIETFGGPPTPAVGFGMGDVVLSLVLQDKGLMPKDDEIAERLGQRPDALVIAYEDKNDAAKSAAAEAAIAPTLAALRKGVDGKPGLHARRSYKTTKNVGKLIQDAAKIRARFCVIIESATTAQLKNMDTQEQTPVALSDLPKLIAKR